MEEPHYNEPSAQPVVVNSEPAILIEKAKTRGILISGSARVSTDFACLVRNKLIGSLFKFLEMECFWPYLLSCCGW